MYEHTQEAMTFFGPGDIAECCSFFFNKRTSFLDIIWRFRHNLDVDVYRNLTYEKCDENEGTELVSKIRERFDSAS